MFTGIVEVKGSISNVQKNGGNVEFEVVSSIGKELKVDQSVSHNGVCLTVTRTEGDHHWVTAVDETLRRSNLGMLTVGSQVNLERCMKADGRYDGHIVQGHVDLMAEVTAISNQEGSWLYDFRFGDTDEVMVDKGSVTVNGVSLTCFDTKPNGFRVAIIPFTYEHTNFQQVKVGDKVNIEFDILGKYMRKLLEKGGLSGR
ncbi:MAG: riboflavin synthase [Cyclobacteriaceae bacterium]|nr:riboflavin synthase [Cyclobacteriaceae bacterium]